MTPELEQELRDLLVELEAEREEIESFIAAIEDALTFGEE